MSFRYRAARFLALLACVEHRSVLSFAQELFLKMHAHGMAAARAPCACFPLHLFVSSWMAYLHPLPLSAYLSAVELPTPSLCTLSPSTFCFFLTCHQEGNAVFRILHLTRVAFLWDCWKKFRHSFGGKSAPWKQLRKQTTPETGKCVYVYYCLVERLMWRRTSVCLFWNPPPPHLLSFHWLYLLSGISALLENISLVDMQTC